jgi:ribonuclease VapC
VSAVAKNKWKTAGCLVFDSWALMAFLQGERGAAQVEELIAEAVDSGTRMLVTSINMGEVWYSVARKLNSQQADTKVAELERLGLTIEPADWELTRLAASLKVGHRLSYADCFAAALAKREDTSLVTGDKEFEQLAESIDILWLTANR